MRRGERAVAFLIAFFIPVAFNSTKIATPLKIVDVGIGAGIVILPITIGNIFQIFLRPTFGSYSERLGHKRIFSFAPVLYGLAFILYYFSKTPIEVILASIVLSIGISAFWSPFLAYSSFLDENKARGVADVLTASYFGAFVGTALSGYLFEALGFKVFFFGAVIMFMVPIIAQYTSLTGSLRKLELNDIVRRTYISLKDTVLNANAIALVPVVNAYGPILMLEAGLTPTEAGLLLTIFPIMSAITQQLGGKLYGKLVGLRWIINLFALALLASFAFVALLRIKILTIASFLGYSTSSSLIFTPQLTKSIESSGKYRGVGSGGFGAGMNVSRVMASTVAMGGGYLAEQGAVDLYPPIAAIYSVVFFLGIITIINRIVGEAI